MAGSDEVNVLNPPNPEIPSEQMLRYYKILLIAARGELVRALPKDYYIRTLWPLRRSLSSMEKADPRMAAEAIAIFIGYRKFLSKEQVLREEADDRIEAADDKLARAITEAESASDVNLKDYLWYRAATIALPRREGDRKKAIDLLMKAEPTLGTPGKPNLRDQTLRTIASRGGAYQDYEGARYAVERIKNQILHRGFALLSRRLRTDEFQRQTENCCSGGQCDQTIRGTSRNFQKWYVQWVARAF